MNIKAINIIISLVYCGLVAHLIFMFNQYSSVVTIKQFLSEDLIVYFLCNSLRSLRTDNNEN